MRALRLFIASAVLLMVGVGFLIQRFHGTAKVTIGAPLSGSVVELNGSATGGWALLWLLIALIGAVLFFISFLSALASVTKPGPGEREQTQASPVQPPDRAL